VKRLDGKVAVVTGAAGGIGAAMARRLGDEGASVVVADVLDVQARAVAAESGSGARAVHLDVTSESDWADLVATVLRSFGRIDVLVNNAGVVHFSSIRKMSAAEYRRVVDVNQVGVFLGMRAVVDPMTQAGGGSIVNVSSTAGLRGTAGQISYVASKWAVTGMTLAAAVELAPRRIRVNSIHPGPTDTAMLGSVPGGSSSPVSGTLLQRSAEPEEIAAAALFLVSDESSFCTGTNLVVDGGTLAFLPGTTARTDQ
jgi:3alpha(or 20beta)-hydroxysteroid dehydrogenase